MVRRAAGEEVVKVNFDERQLERQALRQLQQLQRFPRGVWKSRNPEAEPETEPEPEPEPEPKK